MEFTKLFVPSNEQSERRHVIYGRLLDMMQLKDDAYPHFSGPNGKRSFNQYLDDSEKILNGYTMSRSEQGKEEWQCVSEDTEILTLDGWKAIGDIEQGSAVLSYDIESGSILDDVALATHEYRLEDTDAVLIKNAVTDQLLTTNHRVLASKKSSPIEDDGEIEYHREYGYIKAEDIPDVLTSYRIPTSGTYDGDVSIGEDFAELIGWFLTDGCMPKNGGAYITQAKPATLKKLKDLLDSMGVEYREWSREKYFEGKRHLDEHRFYFPKSGEVGSLIYDLIPDRKPTNVLLRLKLSEKKRLIEGICNGDGSRRPDGKWHMVTKPDSDFLEWFQTLIHLSGLRSSFTEKYANIAYKDSVDIQPRYDVSTITYTGRVWSITTERSNYIAKRNGKIFITGNSNMLDNITLAKMRATATGVGLKVPDMHFEMVNKGGIRSWIHADLLKNITKQTFNDGNPVMHSFLEVWMMLSHGGLIEYEGYKTGGVKQKVVKSFDSVTGDVETETKYVRYDSKPHSVIINPQDFFWWDMYKRDIQDQPHLAWVQHYHKFELEAEFSKYPNYKYVLDKKSSGEFGSRNDTLYYDKWASRVEDIDDYEVIRYYSKADDSYEVWCNGVPLLQAPLLWTTSSEKYYPFAKSISNPFANPNFFWGMSFPGILEAYQEQKNTVANTLADILYQSSDPRTLIGLQNKDVLDFETNYLTVRNNRYYVPDVSQIRLEPTRALNNGDFAFLQILDKGIESLSIDKAQQGQQSGGQKTAREVVIANERAQELKGMLYMFLEDLWLQKTRLRVKNILNYLLKDKASEKDIREQIISIMDYTFTNGEQGTLDVHVASGPSTQMDMIDIESREQAAAEIGDVYKVVSIIKDTFDDFKVDCYIIPESLHQADKMKEQTNLEQEVQTMATLFPEDFVANKKLYKTRFRKLWGKTDGDYVELPPPAPMMPGPMPGQSPLQEGAAAVPPEQQPVPQIIS